MKAFFVSKRIEAPDVKTFTFRTERPLNFEAGQYIFFNFRLGGKEYAKHFTISCSPTRSNLELTTIMSGSDYKKALDSLEEGHEIELMGPMGEFTLKKAGNKKTIFLAGGIGITPVRSMLQFLADSWIDREIVLFYSNRNIEKIVFRHELEELAGKIPSLKIIHTLTELSENEKEKWRGETGFINGEMIARNAKGLKEAVFFVVGPPKFNGAMVKMLKAELRISGRDIITENFSGY